MALKAPIQQSLNTLLKPSLLNVALSMVSLIIAGLLQWHICRLNSSFSKASSQLQNCVEVMSQTLTYTPNVIHGLVKNICSLYTLFLSLSEGELAVLQCQKHASPTCTRFDNSCNKRKQPKLRHGIRNYSTIDKVPLP